jgi:hypothetical protein
MLTPDQKIIGLDGVTVGDFWSWAYSDILSNRNRSVFAEFLVGTALGVVDSPRVEWDAVDLNYKAKKIEVKSAAYVQSWQQQKPSRIVYNIGKKKSWDAATNTYSPEPLRAADCFVFCLLTGDDSSKVNVLDISAWHFYVLLTEQINQELLEQKSIRIEKIQQLCQPVSHAQLRACIDRVLQL